MLPAYLGVMMNNSQGFSSKLKRSFIPKSLRPDVQGQYYTPEIQTKKDNTIEADINESMNFLENFTIQDIKDYNVRRKIILHILTNDLDEKYSHLQNYVNVIKDMFPNIPKE